MRLHTGKLCVDCGAKLCFDEVGHVRACSDCVEDRRVKREARNKRIVELYASGMKLYEVARVVGCAQSTARLALRADEAEKRDEAAGRNAKRCPRCTLCLPHDGCMPTIYELAARRTGDAA
jgi:hypothetical protein